MAGKDKKEREDQEDDERALCYSQENNEAKCDQNKWKNKKLRVFACLSPCSTVEYVASETSLDRESDPCIPKSREGRKPCQESKSKRMRWSSCCSKPRPQKCQNCSIKCNEFVIEFTTDGNQISTPVVKSGQPCSVSVKKGQTDDEDTVIKVCCCKKRGCREKAGRKQFEEECRRRCQEEWQEKCEEERRRKCEERRKKCEEKKKREGQGKDEEEKQEESSQEKDDSEAGGSEKPESDAGTSDREEKEPPEEPKRGPPSKNKKETSKRNVSKEEPKEKSSPKGKTSAKAPVSQSSAKKSGRKNPSEVAFMATGPHYDWKTRKALERLMTAGSPVFNIFGKGLAEKYKVEEFSGAVQGYITDGYRTWEDGRRVRNHRLPLFSESSSLDHSNCSAEPAYISSSGKGEMEVVMSRSFKETPV